MKKLLLVSVLALGMLAGCQTTGNVVYNFYLGDGQGATVDGVRITINYKDTSTTNADQKTDAQVPINIAPLKPIP